MTPPKKRKLDSQDSGNGDEKPTSPPPTRSNCLYFNDGNIVLIAENTAFRVHKSVLALHSDVFRNMFDDVNQPEDAEVFDSCSVVRLSDESEALETFLKALYMIEPISNPEKPVVYFSHVLRLATKYLCNAIRRHALDSLRCKYHSDDLSAWDTQDPLLDPGCIIRLARDIKAEVLLPGAFYEFCPDRHPRSKVNPDDVITFFVGNAELGAFWPEFLEKQMVHCKGPPCKHPRCGEGWRIFSEKRTSITIQQSQFPWADPLSQFYECSQDIDNAEGVCLETRTIIKKFCHEKREEVWNKLPEMFGLESWEKLRAEADGLSDEHVESPPSPAVPDDPNT